MLVLLGAGWGIKTWSYARAHETTDDAQVDGHIVPVLAKVGGYVQRVTVDENTPVKEGQLLVQIDSADYAVRVAQAAADLAAAEVERLSSLVAQLRTQVEERDTRIRHLEAENETLKANQARAREALLNSL